ncbi:hypothetical protein [Bacillus pseudomycoides]|uniref:hypothetical protein n=1 Tax=Bacillus pseudomycoides TaxID=64104 RepID=UPI000BEB59F6|nr:hypothetical protein [Bacillus pseudomycoides]PEE44180.1 hypothetical protein COO02_03615 [Bacillus pseudomycoides]PGA94806.1 hypothetical protein COL91_01040 [Bacillus pseudomycoides]PHF51358.1 hypothetical protein COF72_01975 [Bacillus pseudomycoides]
MLDNYGGMLIEHLDLFLVRCPRCNGCARVFTPNNAKGIDELRCIGHESKRLLCRKCGLTKDIHSKRRWDNVWKFNHELFDEKQGVDWYFGLPLYLQKECCGHSLWFFNLEHLHRVEDYVKKRLRPFGSYYLSVESRLQKWIKLSKK